MNLYEKLLDKLGYLTRDKLEEIRLRDFRKHNPLLASAMQAPSTSAAQNIAVTSPVVVEAPKSVWSWMTPRYSAKSSYNASQLLRFVDKGLFHPVDRWSLANDLSIKLTDTSLDQKTRFRIGVALATMLPEGSRVSYGNDMRGDSFFASLAVDLFLADPSLEKSTEMRARFVNVLSHWLYRIAPGRQEFNIQGAILTRDTLEDWLRRLKDPSAEGTSIFGQKDIEKTKAKISQKVENLMYGKRGNRVQSVHDSQVKSAGSLMVKNLTKAINGRIRFHERDLRTFLFTEAMKRNKRAAVEAGLNHIESHRLAVDADSEVEISPGLALRVLVQYIQIHKKPVVTTNLLDSLLICLEEIGREKPCFTGCSERILNIPNGIDPDLSVIPVERYLTQEVSDLAARVRNTMADLFEGTELEEAESLPGVDETVLAEIRGAVFKQTADLQLGRLRGIPEAQYKNEVQKMLPGFTM
ncbi:MAG TPA: hypothetical protein VFV43_08670 [Limnobacter sp.]|nr:hypothetical protein [Limnobacter sp.]